MARILLIDTSSLFFSMAIAEGSQIIASKKAEDENKSAALISLFAAQLLDECSLTANQIDAISLCDGPGSYTGLRIGASFAKGFCYGIQKPLIAISKLKVMAFHYQTLNPQNKMLICPMVDARRMEVYMAIFDNELEERLAKMPYDLNSKEHSFDIKNTVFLGDGASKLLETYPDSNCLSQFSIEAKHFKHYAAKAFQAKKIEKLTAYEPDYFKPFYSTAKPLRFP